MFSSVDRESCRRHFALVALASLGATSLTTCHPTGFEFKGTTYHSEHFDYLFHPDDATVCPDVIDSLEQHEALLANYLGIDETTLPRVTYFKMRDDGEYVDRAIVGESGAESGPRYVVSPMPFDEHELMHTITLGAWGYSSRFLMEGIATALSCEPSAVEVTNQPYTNWWALDDTIPYESNPAELALYDGKNILTIEQLYDLGATGSAGYAAAGAVTTYLIDSAGVDKFRQLWASVSESASATNLSAALQNIYGFSLDDVWQTLQTTRHRPCAPVWMCSLPPITNNEQGTLRSTCTGKDLGRPTSGNLRLQYPPISQDVLSRLHHSALSPVVTGVSLIPCDGDPANYLPRNPEMQHRNTRADTWIPPLAVPNVVTLETFAWVLQNLQTTYNTSDGQIIYQTLPLEPPTTRCSEAVANIVPSNTTSALWLPNDSLVHFARFRLAATPQEDQYLEVSAYGSSIGMPAALGVGFCTSCNGDDATNCNGYSLGTTDFVVRFQNTTTTPDWLRLGTGDSSSFGQGAALDAGTDYSGEVAADASSDADAGTSP